MKKNNCNCELCKSKYLILQENDEIKCPNFIRIIKQSNYCNKILSSNRLNFVGAFWLNNNKNIIIKPKIENIDFMKIFSLCLEQAHFIKDFHKIYYFDFTQKPIKYNDIRLSNDLNIISSIHFIKTLEMELKNGLKKNFIRKEENLNAKIKGKINISKHINKNIISGNLDKVYCSYLDYDINCIENRILKRALRICNAKLRALQYNINDNLLYEFKNVSNDISIKELKNIKINPIYKKYQSLIDMAVKIIRLRKYQEYCDEDEIPPFYINMSLLFEKYVYSLLLDKLSYNHKIIYDNHYLNNLSPDFIIIGDKYNFIADTKYKEIYNSNNFIQEDFKQLSSYTRVKNIILEFSDDINYNPKCLIIYPYNTNLSNENNYINLDHIDEIPNLINFYKLGIHLPVLKDSVNNMNI